jgi:hypothetical protein
LLIAQVGALIAQSFVTVYGRADGAADRVALMVCGRAVAVAADRVVSRSRSRCVDGLVALLPLIAWCRVADRAMSMVCGVGCVYCRADLICRFRRSLCWCWVHSWFFNCNCLYYVYM